MDHVRALSGLMIATLLLLRVCIGGPPVAAQDAAAMIGTVVAVTNEESVPAGSITIEEVVDPFTDVNPDYPAEAGARYVVARVAFDADAEARFDIAPFNIVLQDADGFLWNQASLILPDDALYPELSSQELAPGSKVTGLIGFAIPEEAVPARFFYQPISSRLVLLAELAPMEPPAPGTSIAILDSEGNAGLLTVTSVTDPLLDLAEGTLVPAGGRYVLVTLSYENAGDGRFFSEPYGLMLQDANGDFWNTTYVDRLDASEIVPDLSRVQLAPGDRISGAVVFELPADVPATGLYLSPTGDRLIQLASFTTDGLAAPVATPMAAAPDEALVATATGDAPCAQLDPWVIDSVERLNQARELIAADLSTLDAPGVSEAAGELSELAASQAALLPPAQAEAVNKALTVTLRALAASLPGAAGGDASSGDGATYARATERLAVIEGEFDRIVGECTEFAE